MTQKIILITNRGVRENRTGETLFKNRLTKDEIRLRCAKVDKGSTHKKYSLTSTTAGNEENFIKEEIESSDGRPWVFFIHGNNQTLHKNLKKCFGLRDNYKVNVLAFSWPSVHHGKIRNLIGYVPFQPNPLLYASRQLKRKLKQYGKARKNAKLSAQDLANALLMFGRVIEGKGIDTRLVCHSLGHRVLKLSEQHEPLASSLSPFSKVLLHQADELNEGHLDWVEPIGKGRNFVITSNKNDKVLELSNLYNHKSLKNKRLGNVPKDDDGSAPQYKNFTGMRNLGFSGHTMFLLSEEENHDTFVFFKGVIG